MILYIFLFITALFGSSSNPGNEFNKPASRNLVTIQKARAELPDEILKIIFSYSSKENLFQVSKRGGEIGNYYTQGIRIGPIKSPTEEKIKKVLSQFPNLKSIKFYSAMSDPVFSMIINCLPAETRDNITYIELYRCNNIISSLGNLQGLPRITQLNLEGCKKIIHVPLLTHLTDLNLSKCGNITDNTLRYCSLLTQLNSLNLEECNNITNEGLRYLSALINMERLNLRSCEDITNTGLRYLSALINMEALDLRSCGDITNAGLRYLSGLINLTALSLGPCKSVTDNGIIHLSPLTNINKLCLHEFEKITDDGLMAALYLLTNLTELDLRGGDNITDSTLIHLSAFMHINDLSLYGVENITDNGLNHLSLLTNLRHLNLHEIENISPQARKELNKNLPQLNIYY